MASHPVYVCQRTDRTTRKAEVVLSLTHPRELQGTQTQYRWELLRMVATIQVARALFPLALALFTKTHTGLTAEGRANIAAAKRGANNPNAQGIPEERKRRIQATIKARDRRQVRNPFFGHKHRADAKAKIALAAQRRRFKWATEPTGLARQVPRDFVLPQGWGWGHGGFRRKRNRRTR